VLHDVPREVDMNVNLTPRALMLLLADGFHATQLLYVAADLGLADRMADGPRTAESLAAEVEVDARTLRRVMRGLASFGVFDESGDDTFGLTETGTLLREGVPGSFRGFVLARAALYYPAFGGLRDSVRDGGTAFQQVFGTDFWSHLATRPDHVAAFQAHMSDRSGQETSPIVESWDFGSVRSLVDVGGGHGVLLKAIQDAHPGVAGVLFDRPEVVAKALPSLETVGGDFFAEIPEGADAYLLSRILHDWDDPEAGQILTGIRKAMRSDSKVLVVEAVLPERAIDCPAAIRLDLTMLALFNSRERTEAEFADLFARAGLRLDRLVSVDASIGLHVLEAVAA
jgi:orsellinic acid C2-O-methyltransferase